MAERLATNAERNTGTRDIGHLLDGQRNPASIAWAWRVTDGMLGLPRAGVKYC